MSEHDKLYAKSIRFAAFTYIYMNLGDISFLVHRV